RMAPPLKGEVGSTAMTPTVLRWARRRAVSRSTSVDLPAPGGPVMPTTRARPLRAKTPARTSRASGRPSSTSVMARASARTSPPRTPATSAGTEESATAALPHHPAQAQELAGDDQALDLARALADRAQLRVPKVALHRVVLDVAVAPVDLHRLHGHLDGGLAGVELGHGGLHGVLLARVAQRGRPPGQEARGIHLGGHVRDLELDGLEVRDGVAELAAVRGVAVRGLERGLGDAQREGGDPDAPAVQDAQGVDEPVALLAQQVRGGDAAVLEDQLRRVRRA